MQIPKSVWCLSRVAFVGCVIVVSTCLSGCHLRPNLGPPGSIGVQRDRAINNDPYPDNDLGPPVMGGRPLGFDRPFAQARQMQPLGSQRANRGAAYTPQYGF